MTLSCLLTTAFGRALAPSVRTFASSSAARQATYRDLSAFDPMLDLHDLQAHSPASVAPVNPRPAHPRATDGPLAPTVLHLNDPPPFRPTPPPPSALFSAQDAQPARLAASRLPGLRDKQVADMHRYVLVVKRVSHMTAKGRTKSWYVLVVAGNGDGVVGLGEGKGDSLISASDKGFVQALRNMTAIERYERRTIWTTRVGKIAGVQMKLWQRPRSFGLRLAPIPHQIAKAAGISDLAGKAYGKNKMHAYVEPSAVRLLTRTGPSSSIVSYRRAQTPSVRPRRNWKDFACQASNYLARAAILFIPPSDASSGFGDGFGGRGHRSDKGIGMRTAEDVGRVLGRRPVYP